MDLSSIRSLLTPSVLFLLLNLIIGTIAVISARHRHHRVEGDGGGDHQRPIARSSSSNVLGRVRSLGLFRFGSGDLPPIINADDADAHAAQEQHQSNTIEHQFRRIQSESDPKTKTEAKENSMKMEKSVSAMTWRSPEEVVKRPSMIRREASVDEEVDAKADDFISRFKQQLKLQRLDSLLRYNEMLTKGK